ncbi:hypothetical protein EIN_138170 [Entamoeba invadens IP1]|uniref:Uncharacterized protein n=1 Tax=Entamoeba invadens IP1 TaxID=370355 RepID=L7FNI5_ENTIV|nr:hypothetical protein EIN_138170 [Entamoeba invadens IP1]ELP91800.1 hypothetical protein EIN_138170 [Entamoeba invadens IP1]|eukprot:XP_004258571.1 hypothetical protein EIN_138170 [Entamoeba invadens IP1]
MLSLKKKAAEGEYADVTSTVPKANGYGFNAFLKSVNRTAMLSNEDTQRDFEERSKRQIKQLHNRIKYLTGKKPAKKTDEFKKSQINSSTKVKEEEEIKEMKDYKDNKVTASDVKENTEKSSNEISMEKIEFQKEGNESIETQTEVSQNK